jgi:hypothetical protein
VNACAVKSILTPCSQLLNYREELFAFALKSSGCSAYVGLRGGLIFVIAKIWSRDRRQTFKSCAGVLIIGSAVAIAMVIIRLVGEQRLQRFLNRIMSLKRKPEAKELTGDSLVTDNQS